MTTNSASAVRASRYAGMPAVLAWPAAGIGDEDAKRAFQRAKEELSVCDTTPSFIVDKDGGIVAQTFERRADGIGDKDHLAEMWARARLLAHAPKMYEALQIIGSQSIGSDYTAEEAVRFVKQFAREVMAEARGFKPEAEAARN